MKKAGMTEAEANRVVKRNERGEIMLDTVPEGFAVVPSLLGRGHDTIMSCERLARYNGTAALRDS